VVVGEQSLIAHWNIELNLILLFIPYESVLDNIPMLRFTEFYNIKNHLLSCFLKQELKFWFEYLLCIFVFLTLLNSFQWQISRLLLCVFFRFLIFNLTNLQLISITVFPYEVNQIRNGFMLELRGGGVYFTEEVFREKHIDLINQQNLRRPIFIKVYLWFLHKLFF
jgi:hypothetical protein